MPDFRPATAADAPALTGLLNEVQCWLAGRGLAQWRKPFAESWAQAEIALGSFHVLDEAGRLLAVCRLLPRDPEFWGHDAASALYLHTLAVARSEAGRGLGRLVLAQAAQKARDAGLHALRLDCLADNAALVRYYADQGFRLQGHATVRRRRHALYELAVGASPG